MEALILWEEWISGVVEARQEVQRRGGRENYGCNINEIKKQTKQNRITKLTVEKEKNNTMVFLECLFYMIWLGILNLIITLFVYYFFQFYVFVTSVCPCLCAYASHAFLPFEIYSFISVP